MLCLRALLQQKITTRLQNKFHPDSPENQTVWKSNNQGFKATFFQIDRRVGDAETQRGMERWQDGWFHIQVWIKTGRNTSRTSDTSPRPDYLAQGSCTRMISSHNFWLQKPVVVEAVEETAGFKRLLLKGPRQTQDSRRQKPSGIQHQDNRWKVTSGIWGEEEEIKSLARGRVPRRQPSLRQSSESRQRHCPHSEPSLTQSCKAVKWVALPWWLLKAPSHTVYRWLFYNRPHY